VLKSDTGWCLVGLCRKRPDGLGAIESLIPSVVVRLANSTNALARAEMNFDAQVQKPVKTG
jgi:hypothetical protein